MSKGRLEAFSDGVFAVIITIMVLDMKVPTGATFAALKSVLPVFLSYVLSFVYLGIYWNNHHHLLHASDKVSGGILWANLHLLFWLSLAPFATAWLGENPHAAVPAALYGAVLFFAGAAYFILTTRVFIGMAKLNPSNLDSSNQGCVRVSNSVYFPIFLTPSAPEWI
jgi:uncharacterized membrane protein